MLSTLGLFVRKTVRFWKEALGSSEEETYDKNKPAKTNLVFMF